MKAEVVLESIFLKIPQMFVSAVWMQEEMEQINRTLTGAERKAALCALLEEETQLIACIGMHKLDANLKNQQKSILHLLGKVSNQADHTECQITGTENTPAKYKKYLL